ncbi:hypothetical protein MASR2M12_09410 [Bacteroidales bacterium]
MAAARLADIFFAKVGINANKYKKCIISLRQVCDFLCDGAENMGNAGIHYRNNSHDELKMI